MNATIKDVARLSGVGISTVSRVLNGSGPVSQEKKNKVMTAVHELGYLPNNNAKNLKRRKSDAIMIMAKSVGNPFFQKVIHVMENLIQLRGYSMEIKNISTLEDEMAVARQQAKNGNACGIIMLGGHFGYTNEDFESLNVPCVLVTYKAADVVDESLYSSVIIDDKKEMKKATEYLIGLGHRRIGCIYSDYGEIVTPNRLRYDGYCCALKEHGIPFDAGLVSSTLDIFGSGYEFGFNMMKSLMLKNPDMTAVVTMADIMAIGAAKAALATGHRIPEDISIIGFDGIEAAEYYHPALDTIAQPAQLIGQYAVDALTEVLQGGNTQHVVLESDLIRRGSSARVQ